MEKHSLDGEAVLRVYYDPEKDVLRHEGISRFEEAIYWESQLGPRTIGDLRKGGELMLRCLFAGIKKQYTDEMLIRSVTWP